MYDKELTQKVCNLTCTKKDVVRDQTKIKYDNEHPFRKYYNIKAIIGAIEKFLSGEWDDQLLSHWACIYCWILLGGCDYDNMIADLNTFEGFLRDKITWDLDGLSFFRTEHFDDYIEMMHNTKQFYEDFDHIWNTRDEWKAVYAMIGPNAEENGEQYVVLVNDITKEYMLIFSDHIENGFEDEHFRFITQDEFIAYIEQLKSKNYKILSCAEEYYYMELEDM